MSLIDGIYWQNVYDADKLKEKIPETNYDRIIRKTPEELAEWLDNNTYRFPIYKDWLDWLRQEVEE